MNALATPENAFVMVTHYQRLLNYIEPDYVHVFAAGRIARSGSKDLALELEEKGYESVRDQAAATSGEGAIG